MCGKGVLRVHCQLPLSRRKLPPHHTEVLFQSRVIRVRMQRFREPLVRRRQIPSYAVACGVHRSQRTLGARMRTRCRRKQTLERQVAVCRNSAGAVKISLPLCEQGFAWRNWRFGLRRRSFRADGRSCLNLRGHSSFLRRGPHALRCWRHRLGLRRSFRLGLGGRS